MKSFILVGTCALATLACDVATTQAAWNNVFQPTLFGRLRRQSTSSYYVAPVVVQSSPVVAAAAPVVPTCNTCQSAPPSNCSTSYTQRCFYQPVTSYQTQTYYEPVTTYRTSYYYEPVTSYRMSCYYDPCSCSYQQVATPVTSYQLRAQSCPVQSWVSRCVQVPVTSYQKSCYWQPQTTCCTTTEGALIPVNGAAPAPPAAPAAPPSITPVPPITNSPAPPNVEERRSPPPANNGEPKQNGTGSPTYDRYYPPQGQPAQFQPQPRLGTPTFSPAPPPPPVKLDRIVVGPDAQVDGQVVRSDNAPRPGAKVLFVNTATGQRETITANGAGRFRAELPGGDWLVFLHGVDGTPMFYTRLAVVPQRTASLTVLSR